ncbi:MAG TPA: hypothetical protein PKD45_15250 [Flavobacteriales bacterium]|nr:hypothetical protein [Flavobacteriales bacterium]
MHDDYPNYNEWYSDFLTEVKARGYHGPVDKEGIRGYYEVYELYPDEAARHFIDTRA